MKKETKYQQILKKLEERKHVKEMMQEYMDCYNKSTFLKEHGYVFTQSGLSNLAYVLPNGTLLQEFNTLLLNSTATTTASYVFTVPYKITFSIANSTLSVADDMFFIRDSVAFNGVDIQPWPSQQYGNQFIFGQSSASSANQAIVATQTSSGTLVNSSFGATTPLNGCLITVQESIANQLQINFFDGAGYNTQTYTNITGVFTTAIRNIGLFAFKKSSAVWVSAFQIVPTVSW